MGFEVAGKNSSSEKREEVVKAIEREREEKAKFQPGEIEKKPEEVRLILKLNDYLTEEQKELGIKDPGLITPEQVHYFQMSQLDEVFYAARYRGSADSVKQFAVVYLSSRISLPEKCEETLHEMAHLASHTKVRSDDESELPDWFKPDRVSYDTYRAGHIINNKGREGKEGPHYHFIGLDEAIIQKMIVEIINKKWGELEAEFGFKDEDKGKLFKSYRNLVGVLDLVIRGVAQKEAKSEDVIWGNFKRAEFTGGLQHLRAVEHAFGKGAIRILAALPNPHRGKAEKLKSGTDPGIPMKKTRELIEQFFQEPDQEVRDRIAKQLLATREYDKYIKRQNTSRLREIVESVDEKE